MTKDQAMIHELVKEIDSLKAEIGSLREQQPSDEDVQRVVDYLLEPIKKPISDDCVSRADVKDKAIQLWNGSGDEDYKFNTLVDYINELPPVTPTQRWIPVSERLPKCEQKVLVLASYRNNTHLITTGMYEDGSLSECDSIWYWEDVNFEKWDDENDCGIIPEGWYEYHEYNPDGVLNYAIDTKVIAWQPLPKPKAGEDYNLCQ